MKDVEGTRQINSITSGYGGPSFRKGGWCNKIGGGDCLLKTQDSAKLKDDV